MDHVLWSLGLLSKTTSWGTPTTKPGDHDIPNTHNRWFILFYSIICEDLHEWKLAEILFG